MHYAPFHEYCPKDAESETRSIAVVNDPDLPAGDYALLESYCQDPDCDCRRVFLCVRSRRRVEAVIAFGWESRNFYARWMGSRDPRDIDQFKGPCLNLMSPQSDLAPALLRAVQDVLEDASYVASLKRHYAMFKQALRAPAAKRR